MAYVIMMFAANEEEANRILNLPDRAVGMYQLPSKHDDSCTGYCQRGKAGKLNGWGRHPTDGYVVHQCGRPHKDRRSRIRTTLLDILGINLLDRENTPALFQNPSGYGN